MNTKNICNTNNKTSAVNFIRNEKVYTLIQQFLNVRKKEKHLFGEVFTPIELIREMLSKLPVKVWKNTNLKWLDPANGIGNFSIVVYYKLMESLENKIQNEKRRSKHIIENMLYMVELNQNNVKLCKKIFKMIDPLSKPNIFKGSFLSNDLTKVNPKIKTLFNIDKYDIIMGNPPYNTGTTGRSGIRRLDEVFTINAFEILKTPKHYTRNGKIYIEPTGFILFIIKTGIRSLKSKGYNSIIDKYIHYSKTYDFPDNPFKEDVLVNYLLIQNIELKKRKPTIFEYNNIIKKGIIQKGMNIYFLPLPKKLENMIKKDIKKYGNLSNIYRSLKTRHAKNTKYLIISHNKNIVKVVNKKPPGDEYYIILNPSNKLVNFINKYFSMMREYGRFTGFATSKALFYNIPNYK